MNYLEGISRGELDGKRIWQLKEDGTFTISRYVWLVNTTKTWMNLLALVAKPLFEWNHKIVMSWGAESLARRLNTTVKEQ